MGFGSVEGSRIETEKKKIHNTPVLQRERTFLKFVRKKFVSGATDVIHIFLEKYFRSDELLSGEKNSKWWHFSGRPTLVSNKIKIKNK